MSKRFLLTLVTLLIIGLGAVAAVYLAKGYRFSTKEGTFLGTGILSITSVPDQASVYLDDHLTTATNTNINNLPPKTYKVKIEKEGYIAWEKDIEIKQGLVSEVKATLFRSIPSLYPLTYSGAQNAVVSPDSEKLAFVVPPSEEKNPITQRKKSGLWVWTMKESQIAFARGGEPHQIAIANGLDYTQAKLRFSPDSSQIIAQFETQVLLLDTEKLNDPPRDITAVLGPTIKSWEEEENKNKVNRLALIKDLKLRKVASDAASLKWSPDETKILYSANGKDDFKVVELFDKKGNPAGNKSHNLPKADGYNWLPNSEHIILVEKAAVEEVEENKLEEKSQVPSNGISSGNKVSVVEFDGSNKAEIYFGNFDPAAVFVWPDSSRLVIISSLPTPTASKPNLFGINLK